jgi:sporulation protein YlmC with PRC-barrel domain
MQHKFCHCLRANDGISALKPGRAIARIHGGVQLSMTSNQFEHSRVSEATLLTERTQSEIANMIAEGSPAPQEDRPATRDMAPASTLLGHRVMMSAREELGNIEEIMLDLRSGRIAWAVLSFSGFPGAADKRFPVPWNALQIVQDEFILDLDRKALEGAPHFDRNNWPDMADSAFGRIIHKYYSTKSDPEGGNDAVNSSGLRH